QKNLTKLLLIKIWIRDKSIFNNSRLGNLGYALKRALTVLFLTFLATSLVATSYALATSPSLTNAIFSIHPEIDRTLSVSSHQGITGSVSIAAFSHVSSLTG